MAKFCEQCAELIQDGAKFCAKCGARTNDGVTEQAVEYASQESGFEASAPIKPKKKKGVFVVVLLAVCICVFGGIFIAEKVEQAKLEAEKAELQAYLTGLEWYAISDGNIYNFLEFEEDEFKYYFQGSNIRLDKPYTFYWEVISGDEIEVDVMGAKATHKIRILSDDSFMITPAIRHTSGTMWTISTFDAISPFRDYN